MKNNIHLQRIMISVLTVALVLGVTVCPVLAYSNGTFQNPFFIYDEYISYGEHLIYFDQTSDSTTAFNQVIQHYNLNADRCIGFYRISSGYTTVCELPSDYYGYFTYGTNSGNPVLYYYPVDDQGTINYSLTYYRLSNGNFSTSNYHYLTYNSDFILRSPMDPMKINYSGTPYDGSWYTKNVIPQDGFPYSSFLDPAVPSDPDTAYSSQVPFYYNIWQSIISRPDFDPDNGEENVRMVVGLFPYMWEYYQRWYYNVHFGYMEDIKASLSNMVQMSADIHSIAQVYEDLYPEDAREMTATMEEQLYDSENGGTSLTEMQTVFGVGAESRDAFDTGTSFSLSGLFSFKNDGNWGFWSTQCQNDMDNVPQVRKSENYDSTAYDDQLEELMSIWGVGNNDK